MNPMVFSLEADRIKLKKILGGNFLQLEMKAISEGENRNHSSFSLEAMQGALPSFRNKPILGYFNTKEQDFESHNGTWKRDSETDTPYWDTTMPNGERILGLIRESDSISIEPDNKGKNWIVLTCALWVQYALPQIKRLLKDKKKKVSVEIDIKDYEDRDGIRYINKFELLGITILGSKNGKPVTEGIEGASASVLDIIDNEVFNRQKTALCFAYKELDGDAVEVEKSNKEDSEQLDNELTLQEEAQVVNCSEGEVAQEECPVAPEQEDAQCQDCHMDDDNDDDNDDDKDDDNDDDQDDDDSDDDKGTDNPEPAYSECPSGEEGAEPAYSGEPEGDGEPAPNPEEELLMKCGELEAKNCELMKRIEELECKMAEKEEAYSKYFDYDEIKEQLAKANQALFAIECEKRVAEAHELLDDENVNKEQCDAIFDKCARGEYASSDALRAEVALAVFNANKGSKTHKKETFTTPIAKPVEIKSEKNMSAMDKLKLYVGRE